ncbi:hypothetical protein EXIGLDRAFT_172548 [Exidia glandulosa HHB12029]|uniref:DRBM domain-containing protein n=1 Tax=Exidia glandulosa HHB12029 TaxID=1314781 RepID=A0A165FAC8_EXIGL|nr:hypothetical protein EXIGLDRAFT_172548 [Exidia glandulosa HHB12029]
MGVRLPPPRAPRMDYLDRCSETHGLVAFLTALTLDDEPLNLRPLAGPLIGRSTAQSPAEPQNHASDFQQAGQDPDSDSALYLHKWLQWRGMHNSLQWTEVSVTRRGGTQGSWTVCAYIDNVEYGKATAESKTEARRIAALMALSQLGVRV